MSTDPSTEKPTVDSQHDSHHPPHTVDESAPQFTWRAIAVGLLFGTLLCFSNMYFGLQTGWISMMSLQSSLVGFAVFKALSRFLKTHFGPAENVVLQTTAVATATMPLAGGFVGILPALSQLTPDEAQGARTQLSFVQLCLWGTALAFFGVFFAVPLRRQTVVREKLRFPSGTATAQMINVLHKRRDPAHEADDTRWTTKLGLLGASFGVSGAYTVLAHFVPAVAALPIFGNHLANVWEWKLTPSMSYAGQGIIMGLPTCAWMLAGAAVGWGVLSPIAKHEGWAPGDVSDWLDGSRGWILWVSLAVMISESVVSLSIIAAKEVRGWTAHFIERHRSHSTRLVAENTHYGSPDIDHSHDQELDEVESRFLVPSWVTWGGLVMSTVVCALLLRHLFSIAVYNTLLAVLLALPLAVLGVRALGETDLNPVSGIGKVSQVVFAGVMPGHLVGNLVAGAISEAGAQQAGDLMQDLKTGHLLQASPRAQFLAQLIGSAFSIFVSAGAYKLYTHVYDVPGETFPAPTAQVWLDMARLVNGHALPSRVVPFALSFAVLFASLTCAIAFIDASEKQVVFGVRVETLKRWWPSGVAFAIGIYNTPNFTLMRVVGAVAAYIYVETGVSRWGESVRAKREMLAVVVASGFVLGEGTLSFCVLLSVALS